MTMTAAICLMFAGSFVATTWMIAAVTAGKQSEAACGNAGCGEAASMEEHPAASGLAGAAGN